MTLYMIVCRLCVFCLFFFFKQKTAYEMRISDWSSDVCSSDLKSGARPGLVDIARIEKPDFDLDNKATWGDDVEGAPGKGVLDTRMDDVVARSIDRKSVV